MCSERRSLQWIFGLKKQSFRFSAESRALGHFSIVVSEADWPDMKCVHGCIRGLNGYNNGAVEALARPRRSISHDMDVEE